jgi:putative transcriptional regulator
MNPSRHPPEELLLSYVAGTAPEPVAVLIASHLALCAACRRLARELEEVGGVLLESVEGEKLAEDSLSRALSRLDSPADPAAEPVPGPPADRPDPRPPLPGPLARRLPSGIEALRWRRVGSRVETARILRGSEGFVTRLVRAREGTRFLRHGHAGLELTLVLAGGFSCGDETYGPGDVGAADETVVHRPVVDADEPCLCLVVESGPIRLLGPWGRLLNPLLKFARAWA